jgi:hypothetical protein
MAQLKGGTRIYGDATVDGRLGLGTNNNIRIGDVSTGSSITTGVNNVFAGFCVGTANTSGSHNNFLGTCSGRANTSGKYNNFFGWQAGLTNTTGGYNNFFGPGAGRFSTGNHNNFFGLYAGCLTTACHNNFFGRGSGLNNTTGRYNNYFGFLSGLNNNGVQNNFIGVGAGRSTTSANNNNFFGFYAGKGFGLTVTGSDNNFFGNCSGFSNTSGSCNNFLGCQSGFNNSTGNHNNFVGWRAGLFNTTGSNNNFFGQSAGCTQTLGDRNVAIGYSVQLPIATGDDQLAIGSGSTSWIVGNSSFNIGIGTTNPTQKLHIVGNARVTGAIYDSLNLSGTTGQVLQSSATGTLWATAAAGGSGTFDTGITSTTFVSVDSGIGTAVAGLTTVQANNDIFYGPGIALSFPTTVGNRYVIQSIHVANTFDNELYLTARHDFNSSTLRVPIANRVVVPYNGALELLEQPTIANPGDILRLQALSGIGSTAGGVDGGLDAWITYSTKTDTNFVGVGTTVTTAGTNVGGVSTYQTVYTSTGFPSVIQSIRIANYNLFIDVDASVAIASSLGIRKGHLAYNLTIPKNSVVELCQQPKRLGTSETIGVSVGSTVSGGANALSVFVSSKYITS